MTSKITTTHFDSLPEARKFLSKRMTLLEIAQEEQDYARLQKTVNELSAFILDSPAIVANHGAARLLAELEFWPVFAALLYRVDRLDPSRATAQPHLQLSYAACLALCLNYSNEDAQIAAQMMEHGLGHLMMRVVMQQQYISVAVAPAETPEEAEVGGEASFEYKILEDSLGTVHNMVRLRAGDDAAADHHLRDQFDTPTFKETLTYLAGPAMRHEVLQTLACLTLAFLVKDAETTGKLLADVKRAVTFILAVVEKARHTPDRTHLGFSVLEMVQGLTALSSIDDAKLSLAECGCLELVHSFLRGGAGGDGEGEVEQTLLECSLILWNLSFDEAVRRRITASSQLIDVLKRVMNGAHTPPQLRKNAEGVLTRCLDEHDREQLCIKSNLAEAGAASPHTTPHTTLPSPASSSPSSPSSSSPAAGATDSAAQPPKFDIFISYCQRNADIMYPVVEQLKKAGFSVWLDRDQIQGSTLGAMADGIDNSRLVLVGMSQNYKDSPNCRCEAEYAFYLKKDIIPLIMAEKYKPTGWLGMMLGTKLYYNFSEKRAFHEVTESLIRCIRFHTENRPAS